MQPALFSPPRWISKLDEHKLLNNKTRTKHRAPPPPPKKKPQNNGSNSNKTTTLERVAALDTGGSNAFYWYQIFALVNPNLRTLISVHNTNQYF